MDDDAPRFSPWSCTCVACEVWCCGGCPSCVAAIRAFMESDDPVLKEQLMEQVRACTDNACFEASEVFQQQVEEEK